MHETKTHTALELSIVKTLSYFDIFQYPLKADEVFLFLQTNGVTVPTVQNSLDELCKVDLIYKFGQFYSLQNDPVLVSKRLKANQEAERYLPIAAARARLIYKFPFVKAVMASGSLSKKCMDENSDIDFFVVTSRNRVWIVRLLMTLYKKILLKNSHKLFCINYYLDEDHLSLADKNVFTATELATVIPLQGHNVYQQLQRENTWWVSKIFPNFRSQIESGSEPIMRSKIIIERLLNILPLQWFERIIMRLTHERWKKLYRNTMDAKDFNTAFKSEPHVSKAHPRNFQKQILERYEAKLKVFSKTMQIPLS